MDVLFVLTKPLTDPNAPKVASRVVVDIIRNLHLDTRAVVATMLAGTTTGAAITGVGTTVVTTTTTTITPQVVPPDTALVVTVATVRFTDFSIVTLFTDNFS